MAKIYEARDRIDDNAYVRYHAKIHQTEMLKCHKTFTDYARQTIKKNSLMGRMVVPSPQPIKVWGTQRQEFNAT